MSNKKKPCPNRLEIIRTWVGVVALTIGLASLGVSVTILNVVVNRP